MSWIMAEKSPLTLEDLKEGFIRNRTEVDEAIGDLRESVDGLNNNIELCKKKMDNDFKSLLAQNRATYKEIRKYVILLNRVEVFVQELEKRHEVTDQRTKSTRSLYQELTKAAKILNGKYKSIETMGAEMHKSIGHTIKILGSQRGSTNPQKSDKEYNFPNNVFDLANQRKLVKWTTWQSIAVTLLALLPLIALIVTNADKIVK